MNNKQRIYLSTGIIALVLTLLFLIVRITPDFIISYIFSLIALGGIMFSLLAFKRDHLPQDYAYPFRAVNYAIISGAFSVCVTIADQSGNSLSPKLYAVLHIALLAIFAVQAIAVSSGKEHIDKIDETINTRHEILNADKENYWK